MDIEKNRGEEVRVAEERMGTANNGESGRLERTEGKG